MFPSGPEILHDQRVLSSPAPGCKGTLGHRNFALLLFQAELTGQSSVVQQRETVMQNS